MSWSVVPFGKYAGKTLPEIIVRDLDWFPDVIRASAVFPNKRRNTLLHTIGNVCWVESYEWALLVLMHFTALARNERSIELREEEERQA